MDIFWGISYRFYVDLCSIGIDVVYNVFYRIFSLKGLKEYNSIYEFLILFYILMLSYRFGFV